MILLCNKCGSSDYYKSGKCIHCEKARVAAYYVANREKRKEYNRKWREKNPDKIKEQHIRWNLENPGKAKINSAKWRAENPEKQAKLSAIWQANHPEYMRAQKHKRKVQKKLSGETFTASDVIAMMNRQRGRCVVCRVDISKNYHIDHVIPLALGGSNGKNNLQLLCPFCNMSKKDRHPIVFMQSRGFLL